MVGSKGNTSRGNSTNSAFFNQVDYFRIARLNLPELAAGAEITSYKPTSLYRKRAIPPCSCPRIANSRFRYSTKTSHY
jgi:hypothetical protein